ncbi:hypothetical protein H5410_011486 [Solanum commersonii]|uniref:Uncharacterized protein n=1 Tax=Solanum commersonii TaxID=4109 RepID=A0A9J6API2_SOLCO|nr:hypothetical protein H5410_011486 [Solanum commersonii]
MENDTYLTFFAHCRAGNSIFEDYLKIRQNLEIELWRLVINMNVKGTGSFFVCIGFDLCGIFYFMEYSVMQKIDMTGANSDEKLGKLKKSW